MTQLLRVEDLTVSFRSDRGQLRAVEGVSFDIGTGETVGLVGESGSGKSVTALSILRLLPERQATLERGRALFVGSGGESDLWQLDESALCRIRGAEIAMVFQEPMTSLNPVYTVGSQIREAIRLHKKVSRRDADARALELLQLVGVPAPERAIAAYPHELSGGMRQRALLAMALSCEPKLLIADEPTTALDVTIQAQVLELLRTLRERFKLSVLLITHDLAVVAENADRVVVMYAGRIIESGTTREVLSSPKHPYTKALLASLPRDKYASAVDAAAAHVAPHTRLPVIPGAVPSLAAMPVGCKFHPRCSMVIDACKEAEPPLVRVSSEDAPLHTARCIRSHEVSP